MVSDPLNSDTRRKANPFAGMAQLLTAVNGALLACVLEQCDMIGMDAAPSFLKGLPANGLREKECFYLHPGDSLWIPFGCIACFSGSILDEADATQVVKKKTKVVGKTKEKAGADTQTQRIQYLISLAVNPEVDVKHSPELCAAVCSNYSSSLPFLPAPIAKHAQMVAWAEALLARGKTAEGADGNGN